MILTPPPGEEEQHDALVPKNGWAIKLTTAPVVRASLCETFCLLNPSVNPPPQKTKNVEPSVALLSLYYFMTQDLDLIYSGFCSPLYQIRLYLCGF